MDQTVIVKRDVLDALEGKTEKVVEKNVAVRVKGAESKRILALSGVPVGKRKVLVEEKDGSLSDDGWELHGKYQEGTRFVNFTFIQLGKLKKNKGKSEPPKEPEGEGEGEPEDEGGEPEGDQNPPDESGDTPDYDAMSYREVQALAKEKGVKASGKKAEIIARL